MSESLERGKRSLRRRIRYFFTGDLHGRSEVRAFCERLNDVGTAAIFGGMLRDLLLEGAAKFGSDIDIVVDTQRISALERLLAPYAPRRTSFGGFRLCVNKWVVDVWPLEWTWAIRKGHVRGDSLADLIRTTFFNWDAVVYELRSGLIHCPPSYVDEINERFLTINLPVNPNPEGCAIRALSMAVRKQAAMSFELAQFTADVLNTVGVDALLGKERERHRTARVSSRVVAEFLTQFRVLQAEQRTAPIKLASRQYDFCFVPSQR